MGEDIVLFFWGGFSLNFSFFFVWRRSCLGFDILISWFNDSRWQEAQGLEGRVIRRVGVGRMKKTKELGNIDDLIKNRSLRLGPSCGESPGCSWRR